MALNGSGPISLGGSTTGQSIAIELGLSPTAQISLNDVSVRTLAGKGSGQIQMPTDFWGKSNAASPTPTPTRTPSASVPPSVTPTPTPTPTRTPSASAALAYLYGITYCNLISSNISSADELSVGSVYYSGIGCFTVDSFNGTTGNNFPDIPTGNASLSSCAASECSGGGPQQ
jgi:hypothetical protein